MNWVKAGSQHTVRFHVDDCLLSHINPRVNDKFLEWLNKHYSKYGAVTAVRGKIHDYLAMVFDFTVDGEVSVDMSDFVKKMLEDFPEDLGNKKAKTPAPDDLFDVGDDEKKLPKKQAETFHSSVAQSLYSDCVGNCQIYTTCSKISELGFIPLLRIASTGRSLKLKAHNRMWLSGEQKARPSPTSWLDSGQLQRQLIS